MVNKDKYIVERLGYCWHEWVENKGHQSCNEPIMCDKCWNYPGEGPPNPDLTTWEGFGWLWDRFAGGEGFLKVWEKTHANAPWSGEAWTAIHLVNPTRFRDAVYEYLHG